MQTERCDHRNLFFTDQSCEAVITLNEQGEAGFYCPDCEHYFICCLACSGLAYDDWNDEVYVVDQVRPQSTWCRFIGLHVTEYDVKTYGLALNTPRTKVNSIEEGESKEIGEESGNSDASGDRDENSADESENATDMNHDAGQQGLYSVRGDYLKTLSTKKSDSVKNDFPFITGTDGGNPLWWKCDCCQTLYSMTDK
jgi:hypothetical protein